MSASRPTSPTRGSRGQSPRFSPCCFTTTTPPRVTEATHIVAAMQPSIRTAGKDDRGWFVSDFFAFNTLFHGLGASQTWLSLASLEALVGKHGQYAHGNAFARRVVLSHELLQRGQITPVTVVREGELVDRFLLEAKRATEAAKRERGHVLLILFCYGLDNEHFALDSAGRKLYITALKGVLEPHIPVRLLTTACVSGGWFVCSDLNATKPTATRIRDMSSWQKSAFFRGLFPGSVFVGSIIGSLTGNKSEFLDYQTGSGSGSGRDNDKMDIEVTQSLQPYPATAEQAATYSAFCRAIWKSCRGFHRLWNEHSFTLSAQDGESEEPCPTFAPSMLDNYEARWNALPSPPYQDADETKVTLGPSPHSANFQQVRTEGTGDDLFIGPLTQMLHQNRIKEMVSLFQQTCPGDRVRGYGPSLNGFMQRCADAGVPRDEEYEEEAPEFHYNVVAIIQYRLNMALLAENILEIVGLPRPGEKSCLMWGKTGWETTAMRKFGVSRDDVRQQGYVVHDFFQRTKVLRLIEPAAEQGPPFFRFQEYLVAAVVEGQLEDSEVAGVLDKIAACVKEAAEFYRETALNSPEVQIRGRDWLKTIGHQAVPLETAA